MALFSHHKQKCGVSTINTDKNKMKKRLLILSILGVTATQSQAQIPNNGFENWFTVGNYMEPQGYATTNSFATTTFYPVTRSTDHYPLSVGNYSIRIENNISLLPNADALGLILQNSANSVFNGPGPAFPISGHPTSFHGYYKYIPQNGDTMRIQIQFYSSGSNVSWGGFSTTTAAPNWTPFSISMQGYSTADSASILISPYNCNGAPPQYVPYGNSVLYVDNLSFDSLITSVNAYTSKEATFKLYPNPATDIISIDAFDSNENIFILKIYNFMGEIVRSELFLNGHPKMDISDLNNGMYTIELMSTKGADRQTLVIQR